MLDRARVSPLQARGGKEGGGGDSTRPACKIQRRRNNVDYGEKIITECSAFRCRLKFVLKCKTFLHKHTNAKCYVNYLTVLILPLTFQLT